VKTCDYCQNPKLVEQCIEGSQVVQDVVNTHAGFARRGQRRSSPQKWDGQWSKPHGDDNDEEDDWQDIWTEGDLGITNSVGDGSVFQDSSFASAAFLPRDKAGMKTSSMLDKYEVRTFVIFS
jgi:hypothetical protein